MVLMADRAQAAGRSAVWLHYRRMAVLILIGLAHAHLVWYGDILVLYGVCGIVLSWLRRFYLSLVILAVAVGIPVILYGVYQNSSHQWDVRYSFFFGAQYNGWGSIAVCLGYVALVMLWCQSGSLAGLQRRLAAIGQTALSNYLLQSLICTTIFYGHGFGLFGRVSRIGQLGLVAAVWLVQLIASPLWLRRFRFGPMEWLWRCATYLRIQPLRRSRA